MWRFGIHHEKTPEELIRNCVGLIMSSVTTGYRIQHLYDRLEPNDPVVKVLLDPRFLHSGHEFIFQGPGEELRLSELEMINYYRRSIGQPEEILPTPRLTLERRNIWLILFGSHRRWVKKNYPELTAALFAPYAKVS